MTTPMCCAPAGQPEPWAVWSRRPPWVPSCAVPVGARPPTGPGESRVAGHGLEGRRWTRRRTIHHRPGFDDLRDLRTGQGGCPPPRLHRRPGLSPAAGRRAGTGDVLMSRLREGRANSPRRRPLGVKRWGGFATAGPAGSSLCGPTAASIPTPWSPSAAGSMSASPSPSARQKPAQSHRGDTRMPGRRFLTGWTVPLLWPRPPTPPSRVSPTPHRCGSSSGGCSPRPFPTGSLRHLQLSRLHHRPGRRNPGTGG